LQVVTRRPISRAEPIRCWFGDECTAVLLARKKNFPQHDGIAAKTRVIGPLCRQLSQSPNIFGSGIYSPTGTVTESLPPSQIQAETFSQLGLG
jgi:hypothetical protein